jgi:hypothetical protein
MHYFIGTRNTSDTINTLLKCHSSLEDLACCSRSELVRVVLLKPKSKSHYNWRSVGHYVKVSSPFWDLWPDITVLLTEASSTYSSVDVFRRTQYRTPVGSLENTFLCCALFTKPYHSNDGAVLLRVCVAMGMFCIVTNICRLVLLRIGYRCSQRVGGFHGRLPQALTP